jgi:N-acetylglucosaminyldiphosphoundecaprenol N-acetyl-beta-D-mannosaminyltransferase
MTRQQVANQKKAPSSVYLLNVRIDSTSSQKLLNTVLHIVSRSAYNTLFTIFTPNPEQLMLAQANDHFRSTLNQSSLNVPDGMGLLWAHRWLSKRRGQFPSLKRRVTGVDSMQALARELLAAQVPIFLLGGRGDAAHLAAQTLITDRAQSAQNTSRSALESLVASDSGSEDITQETEAERDRVLQKIADHGTKVLFVAYGAPQQESWVMANRDQLVSAGVRVAMVVGGAFDVLAGKVRRAPLKWQNFGFEWLWRLMHEPWRWKRQLSLVKFVYLVIKNSKVIK